MPDPQLGERICAFVVLRPGMTLTLQELRSFLLGKEIARFKLPERLEVLEDLPLSRVGKVMKQILVEQAKALVAIGPGK
jgi:2,3-dihydroxybenzoate-AMP ligase